MVFADIRSLCKPIISYFTPIFLTLISYIFELKIYILHQKCSGQPATVMAPITKRRERKEVQEGPAA